MKTIWKFTELSMLIAFLVLAISSVMLIASAHAGVTCQTVGSYTYCTSGSKTVTCQKVGSYTYCS